MAACEPGVSIARLARENGLNANLLFTWRRRYLAEQQAEAVHLVPVAIVNEVPSVNEPPALPESEVVRPAGSIVSGSFSVCGPRTTSLRVRRSKACWRLCKTDTTRRQ
ncbi:transposase [Paraburkholderia sp. EG286B]|uniref:transposase n=1 Tax=Paraburkholderia sp. EG286B TaxID=3237011 RepID=UPI0034D351F7